MLSYRHENKTEINFSDLLALRSRLKRIMRSDSHAEDGRYTVRSLYFDTPADTALKEKQDGVGRREKFRIRYYNGDTGLIRLEKKEKYNNLSRKDSAVLTEGEVRKILEGDTAWMGKSENPLLREFYSKIRTKNLRPKTIVDYTREPFVYAPGNTRVTLDYNIRTGAFNPKDADLFLNPASLTVPVPDNPALLEVKWDAFLPDIVRDAVNLKGRRAGAFSKYAQCRLYR